MGQDGEDGDDGDADVTGANGREPGPGDPVGSPSSSSDPSFEKEIDEALDFERKLFYRGLLAAALVVAVVIVRTLFFA